MIRRTKHCIPLTCEVKIEAVHRGEITKTIRKYNPNCPKRVGDKIMFHGWEGKPYRTNWTDRTPYWEIISIERLWFAVTTDNQIVPYRKCIGGDTKLLSSHDMDRLAISDGFSSWEEMERWFLDNHKKEDIECSEGFQEVVWKWR